MYSHLARTAGIIYTPHTQYIAALSLSSSCPFFLPPPLSPPHLLCPSVYLSRLLTVCSGCSRPQTLQHTHTHTHTHTITQQTHTQTHTQTHCDASNERSLFSRSPFPLSLLLTARRGLAEEALAGIGGVVPEEVDVLEEHRTAVALTLRDVVPLPGRRGVAALAAADLPRCGGVWGGGDGVRDAPHEARIVLREAKESSHYTSMSDAYGSEGVRDTWIALREARLVHITPV